MRLHYFYPANDIALAVNSPGFTPNAGAARLCATGASLPMWYGAAGDRLLAAVNNDWYVRMRDTFRLAVDVWDGNADGLEAAPWGWSKVTRNVFRNAGFADTRLPDDAALDRMRTLSNRATGLQLAAMLRKDGLPVSAPGVAATDVRQVADSLDRQGRSLVKQPWSTSGRGIMDSAGMSRDDLLRQAAGIIRRQGSVMVEPHVDRTADFALLFDADGGRMLFRGLSLFMVDHRYCYTGNTVAGQEQQHQRLTQLVAPDILDNLITQTAAALQTLVGDAYRGPLGVDMMVCRDDCPVAVAEVNLRNTMGRVALELGERILAPGLTGELHLVQSQSIEDDFTAKAARLTAGQLVLTDAAVLTGQAFVLTVSGAEESRRKSQAAPV